MNRVEFEVAGRRWNAHVFRDLTAPHRHFWRLVPAEDNAAGRGKPPGLREYWDTRDARRAELDAWAAEHDRAARLLPRDL